MANTVQNGQTCLEKRGMEERHVEITRSDYNIENQLIQLVENFAKNEFNNSCKFYRDNFSVTEEDISCNNESTIIFYNKYRSVRYIVSLIEKEVR